MFGCFVVSFIQSRIHLHQTSRNLSVQCFKLLFEIIKKKQRFKKMLTLALIYSASSAIWKMLRHSISEIINLILKSPVEIIIIIIGRFSKRQKKIIDRFETALWISSSDTISHYNAGWHIMMNGAPLGRHPYQSPDSPQRRKKKLKKHMTSA